MGRQKTKNRHLPKYVDIHHGSYRYRGPATAWKPLALGRDFADAMVRYGELFRDAGLPTMGDVFDKYEATVIPSKAPATQASNRFELRALRNSLAHMRPPSVTPVHVYKVRDAIAAKLGNTQSNNHLALLKHVFTKAIEWGAVKVNPAREVKKIRVEHRTRLPERWEIDLVSKHASPMLQCAVELAELTSMDRGGVLSVLLTNCRLDDKGIRHVRPKTKRRSEKKVIIKWSDELRAVVKRARALGPEVRSHLIVTRSGKPFTPSGFSTMWQRAMASAEKDAKAQGLEFERFHFHDIRAFSITETKDLLEASKRAGHSSTAITSGIYRRKAEETDPLR